MGNCVWRSFAEDDEAIKVMTANGGVMEFDGPLTAECITNEYPGHGIFHPGMISQPLPNNEELLNGELYYLLPLDHQKLQEGQGHMEGLEGSLEHSSAPYRLSSGAGSDQLLPRISTHTISTFSKCKKPSMEVLPAQKNGVWRVKLVISPEQLTEILSEESNTEALIESVRTVAKCGSNGGCGSDQDQLNCLNEANHYNSWKPSMETISEVVVEESNAKMDRGI
eukprot:Gb_39026 [translate_table: standard]